ncbi:MAG TPA: hypothetical protein VGG84_15220 [Gemmatimonadaceae bacterium]
MNPLRWLYDQLYDLVEPLLNEIERRAIDYLTTLRPAEPRPA